MPKDDVAIQVAENVVATAIAARDRSKSDIPPTAFFLCEEQGDKVSLHMLDISDFFRRPDCAHAAELLELQKDQAADAIRKMARSLSPSPTHWMMISEVWSVTTELKERQQYRLLRQSGVDIEDMSGSIENLMITLESELWGMRWSVPIRADGTVDRGRIDVMEKTTLHRSNGRFTGILMPRARQAVGFEV